MWFCLFFPFMFWKGNFNFCWFIDFSLTRFVSQFNYLMLFAFIFCVFSSSGGFIKKLFLKILFIYFFRERGKEREREERNINVWLLLPRPLYGTWPATQARALIGNPSGDSLVHRPALNPLSYTSQGYKETFYQAKVSIHRLPSVIVLKLMLIQCIRYVLERPHTWDNVLATWFMSLK